jgi:HAD superfamily hydrolase (TIGR01509 family)
LEKIKIKAVYFDAGETLIYRNPSLSVITYRELKKTGAGVKPGRVESALAEAAVKMAPVVAKGIMKDSEKWDIYIKMVFKSLGIKNSEAENVLKSKLKKGTSFRPFGDAVFVLETLGKKGIKTGIISNAPAELRNILKVTGISKHVRDIIVSEEAGYEKPDKRIFLKALKNAGCRPCEMIFVGDNKIADIVGAEAAGVKPLWIRRRTKHAQFSFSTGKLPEKAAVIGVLSQVLDYV